jgi:hypothetical protein
MSAVHYPKKPEKPFFVWFRIFRLVLGLILIALGLLLLISRLVSSPDSGGSGLVPLLITFAGIFIATSTRISKRKASELSGPLDH